MTLGSFVSTVTRLHINQTFKLCFLKSLSSKAFSCGVQPITVPTAYNLFETSPRRDLLHYNHMLFDYSHNERHQEALDLFLGIWRSDLLVDGSTMSCVLKVCGCMFDQVAGEKLTQMIFATLIKLCANIKELGFARQLHCRVLKCGFAFDHNIKTALMVAYNKCSEMDDAFKMFSMVQGVRNVVTWTAMINGYLQNGVTEQAVYLFCQMIAEGVRPNHYTYSTILMAQPSISIVQLHAHVIKTNYEKSPTVGTALDRFLDPPWLCFAGVISKLEVTSENELCLSVVMVNFVI
ncbi:hypothetical protein FEM48_Zijuj02G0000700 [Ziziphus jujuba var. spinosa]|uniref:Uncharacterized protein n=1 Tax=Ziziphus jujuba var. spinosa TaxID=714518 RepID=A0A978VSF3_ZIZJJ|nr:hypothetical protein FEM48_Zijuj02G0000700 [Ziziphus jujuba var. spinosa]